MVSIFSIYREEEKPWVPETAQRVTHAAWFGADTDLSGLEIIKAEEQLNSRILPPQPLPKIPSRNALGSPLAPDASAGSAESVQVIYAFLSSKRPELIALLGKAAADPCPTPSPPQSKDFQLLLCRKCQKHYSTIHYPRFCNFSYVFTLIG